MEAQLLGFICLPNTFFGTQPLQVSVLEEMTRQIMDLHRLMGLMEREGLQVSKLLRCLIQDLHLF